MHRGFRAQAAVQGIGIGQNFRIEQVIKAKSRTCPVFGGQMCDGIHFCPPPEAACSKACWTSSEVMEQILAAIMLSICWANCAVVGDSTTLRIGSSIPKSFRMRAINCVQKSECPPIRKKLSFAVRS